jgi:hypothetical protein
MQRDSEPARLSGLRVSELYPGGRFVPFLSHAQELRYADESLSEESVA